MPEHGKTRRSLTARCLPILFDASNLSGFLLQYGVTEEEEMEIVSILERDPSHGSTECPVCGLITPPRGPQCDCGYDFARQAGDPTAIVADVPRFCCPRGCRRMSGDETHNGRVVDDSRHPRVPALRAPHVIFTRRPAGLLSPQTN
jgi:hypothetical protein